MSRVLTVEVEAPKDLVAGEKFLIEVEIPDAAKKPRGQLAGLSLEDMTDEQIKRETINSNSVLYKAKQRGASDETIAMNQARVDAVTAEKEKRGLTKAAAVASTPNMAAAMEGAGENAEI